MSLFTPTEQDALKAPHVSRAFFVELFHQDGVRYFHNGYGSLELSLPSGGDLVEWIGMSDPFTGTVVGISEVEEPRFGSAPTIQVALAGVNSAYLKKWKDDARGLEGRVANVYFAMFDPESPNQDGLITSLKPLFPGGRVTAPSFKHTNSMRVVGLTVESFFQSQNAPFGGMWDYAGQKRRYSADEGLSEMGTIVNATRR